MKNQDLVYLEQEADNYFIRNEYDFDNLIDRKKNLIDNFSEYLGSQDIDTILEIGCHIGDLLNYCVESFNSNHGYGVEPSIKAIEEGRKRFAKNCSLFHGLVGNDKTMEDIPSCDLVIVNDVFCWISRESIFRSIANIDEHLNSGGHLIIRDFLPPKKIRNQNKHLSDQEVFCHKIVGSHAELFKQTGNYQVISSKIFTDSDLDLTMTKEYDLSENTWVDILLKKTWA
jgi:SAM-dependent methyltransferase